MDNDSQPGARVPSVGLGRRAYLLGPSTGSDSDRARRFGSAVEALTKAGYAVTAPGLTATTADLLSVVAGDMDALTAADVVVTLPGSADLWELAVADALGIPVVPLLALAQGRSA